MSKPCIYSRPWTRSFPKIKSHCDKAQPLPEQKNEIALLSFCLVLTSVAMLLTIPMLINSFEIIADDYSAAQPARESSAQRLQYNPLFPEKDQKTSSVNAAEPSSGFLSKTEACVVQSRK